MSRYESLLVELAKERGEVEHEIFMLLEKLPAPSVTKHLEMLMAKSEDLTAEIKGLKDMIKSDMFNKTGGAHE